MKVLVRERSVINGESWPVGSVIEVSEAVYRDRGQAALRPLDSPEGGGNSKGPALPPKQAPEPDPVGAPVLVAGMTREQTIYKLKELGVNVHPNIGDEKLKERYLETVEEPR